MSLLSIASAGRLDPRPDRWAYDLSVLAGAGVHVDDAQEQLLDPATAVTEVVVPFVLSDPLLNVDGMRYEHEIPRMRTFTADGPRGPVVIPAIGLVDWALDGADPQDWFHSPSWWRFPSVPVRIVVPDRADEAEEVCRCMRVWNCWPLHGSHNDDDGLAWEFMDVSERIYCTGWYANARSYAEHKRGRLDACALADLVDPAEAGRHVHTSAGDCLTGTVRVAELEHELFLDAAPGWWRSPQLGYAFHTAAADELWRRLVASSQRNSAAAVSVLPASGLADVAGDERKFSPWVLS